MLLKLASIGIPKAALTPLLNQLQLQQIRYGLTEFQTEAELRFLQAYHLPLQWTDECFDLVLFGEAILTEPSQRGLLNTLIAAQQNALKGGTAEKIEPICCLVSANIYRSLQQCIQDSRGWIELSDHSKYLIEHPALIVEQTDQTWHDTPLIRVDHWVAALRWRDAQGVHDVPFHQLNTAHVLSFDSLTAIHDGTLWREPADWLLRCLKQLRHPWPNHQPPLGLAITKQGIVLCAGFSVSNIQSLHWKTLRFSHILGTTGYSPYLDRWVAAAERRWKQNCELWQKHFAMLRLTENKTDLCLGLIGGVTPIRKRITKIMQKSGFSRVFDAPQLKAGTIREPTLLLSLDNQALRTEQVETPLILSLQESLAALLSTIKADIDWENLPVSTPEPMLKPSVAALTAEMNSLQQRIDISASRLRTAQRWIQIWTTAIARFQQIYQKIEPLLTASLPKQLHAAQQPALGLITSKTEIPALLRSVNATKPYYWLWKTLTAEIPTLPALHGLLEDLNRFSTVASSTAAQQCLIQYQQHLQSKITSMRTRTKVCEATLAHAQQNELALAERKQTLAAQWLDKALENWFITLYPEHFQPILEKLRARVERHWFLRTNIRRIYAVCSHPQNKESLLTGCASVYPNIAKNQFKTVVCPLFPKQTAMLEISTEHEEHLRNDWKQSLLELQEAIRKHPPDLLVIEHWGEIGQRLFGLLRKKPNFPVIMLTADRCEHVMDDALHNSKLRMSWLPRSNALTAFDYAEQLRLLHAM